MSDAGVASTLPKLTFGWPARALLCIAAAVAVYAPALHSYYIWDDDLWIVGNDNLRSLEGLKQIWLHPTSNPEYYPLTNTVFWIEYHLWGLNPIGYHLAQVLLHAIVAWLVWLVLNRLRVPAAGLAAAIFLVHPVGVETVAWVTEHKNTLSGICLLTAILAFVRAYDLDSFSAAACGGLRSGGEPAASDVAKRVPGWGALLVSAAFYALAVLAKTVAVTLPGVLLVILWWKRGRVTLRDVLSILPHLAIGLPLAGFAVWMQHHHTGATGVEFDLTWPQRLMVAGRVPWFYLGKLLWPWPLVFVYRKWDLTPMHYVGLAASAGLLLGLWFARRRLGRGPLAAMLVFGGMLLPASGFFNVYWHRYTYVADHVQYHACIAVFALIAAALHAGAERSDAPDAARGNRSGAALRSAPAWILLAVLSVMTFNQTRIYYDNERLMRVTAQYNPDSPMPHDNLAHTLVEKGRYAEAVEEFESALKLAPPYPWRLSKAQFNLAFALMKAGRLDDAILHYQSAIAADPAYAGAYYELGNCLRERQRYEEAAGAYRRAIEVEPDHVGAITNLGACYLLLHQYDAAADAFENALRIVPEFAPAQAGLRRARQLGGSPASR